MNKYMSLAIEQAKIAYKKGEVPVGAVIVKNNKVLSCCYNKKNIENVSIYHAEILAIIEACKKLNNWRLDNSEIYVTLKPCEMCLYAIAESRIKKVYYLLDSEYKQNLNSNYKSIDLIQLKQSEKYKSLLSDFFNNVRSDVSRETLIKLFPGK